MSIVLWFAAVVAGVAPRPLWERLEPPLPIRSTAFFSGVATLFTGFFLDLGGFVEYGSRRDFARNDQIIDAVHRGLAAKAELLANAGSALAILTLLEFIFFTPLGLFATYLLFSGGIRAIAAGFDDPRGDFLLSGLYAAGTRLWSKNRAERQQLAREQREGPETPDRLFTGDWAGVDADYVVVASRRKTEWDPGAIVMTGTDWYKLGVPFDLETPSGLRTVYPLTKMEAVEVVRRGILYELPRLSRHPTQKPQNTQS